MSSLTLITGGTGFLGQALARALHAQGEAVRVLAREPHSPPANILRALGIDIVPGDMLDPASVRAALPNVTRVFHLAGRLLVPGVPAQAYTDLHVGGTQTLLTACAELGQIQSIVHCSTTGVLGITGNTPAAEDAPIHPSTIYEKSKAEGEQLALTLARDVNLPVVVARPALVYGPGDLHLLGWFRAIQRGYYAIIGTGDNCLHPIFIDDLTDGLLRCATTPAAIGRVYNLVGERPVPIGELASAIAAALGTRLPPWHIPLPLAKLAATMLEALPVSPERLPLTHQRLAFMLEGRAYRGNRARNELGFVPQVDLPAGLARTVSWYRTQELL